MNGKDFLKQIRDINITIISLQLEIEKMDTILTNTTVKPKDVNVQTSLPSDPMADKVIQMVEYKDKLKECLLRQTMIKGQALTMIDSLESQEDRSVLMLRYINCLAIKDMMDKIDASRTTINNRLKEAEKNFNAIFAQNNT